VTVTLHSQPMRYRIISVLYGSKNRKYGYVRVDANLLTRRKCISSFEAVILSSSARHCDTFRYTVTDRSFYWVVLIK
jgi:hypothetical protein